MSHQKDVCCKAVTSVVYEGEYYLNMRVYDFTAWCKAGDLGIFDGSWVSVFSVDCRDDWVD